MNKFYLQENDNEVMSPSSPGVGRKGQAGATPPVLKEGDLAKIRGDRDGHKFRVMRIVGEYANICCVEHTSVRFLEKLEEKDDRQEQKSRSAHR